MLVDCYKHSIHIVYKGDFGKPTEELVLCTMCFQDMEDELIQQNYKCDDWDIDEEEEEEENTPTSPTFIVNNLDSKMEECGICESKIPIDDIIELTRQLWCQSGSKQIKENWILCKKCFQEQFLPSYLEVIWNRLLSLFLIQLFLSLSQSFPRILKYLP